MRIESRWRKTFGKITGYLRQIKIVSFVVDVLLGVQNYDRPSQSLPDMRCPTYLNDPLIAWKQRIT